MTSVVIDQTDLRVSRISFGTASLHHHVAARQRQRLLACAADQGITHFDTSPYYGDGLAESDLGAFLKSGRARHTVATKVGIYPRQGPARSGWQAWVRAARARLSGMSKFVVDWSVARARASLRDSLRRLGTDHVDVLFLHEPDRSLVDADEFLRWLEAERATGTIRFWGLAGLRPNITPWLEQRSALASIVQTRDDLATTAADFLRDYRRPMQFTYGYLSARTPRDAAMSATEVMKNALRRNAHGSVLVSTRRTDHLAAIASAAQ